MITVADYWMGRDVSHGAELDDLTRANAAVTVGRAATLLRQAADDGLVLIPNPRTGSYVASGWRPTGINNSTPGAAVHSKHLTGEAVDIYDPGGAVDDWCMSHTAALESCGLWLEHPASTKGWCHLQTRPPGSGRRVFYP